MVLEKKQRRAEARRQKRQMSEMSNRNNKDSNSNNSNSNNNQTQQAQHTQHTQHTPVGGPDNGLDSLITQYIAISSSLRAQLHVTQLRIATRMRVAPKNDDGDGEEDSSSRYTVFFFCHESTLFHHTHLFLLPIL